MMSNLGLVVHFVWCTSTLPQGFGPTLGTMRQQVFSMLLRKCRTSGLLIPNLAKNRQDESTYEGATVSRSLRPPYRSIRPPCI